MSAHVSKIDEETRYVWIAYEGRGDELSANLAVYGVDFAPSLYFGQIGLPYKPAVKGDTLTAFGDAAAAMVSILTQRSGVSERDEKEFATSLVIVQMCQNREESQQGRDLADWVRKARIRIGGAA